ncbi:DUF687 domain-containing protein [Chlamydia abortus]|uniref:DUF687 domain-containing protein n=1 Tax=Chlamydia abortus TaxID=83555 RepID=UPI001C72DC4D|nr:DUF687 domain-containing protein [Chlamydia abortus]
MSLKQVSWESHNLLEVPPPPATVTLSLVGSLEGSPSVSEGTQEDSVYSFIHGRHNEQSRNRHPVPIFQTTYESIESTPISTPLIGVGYTNGSQSGLL